MIQKLNPELQAPPYRIAKLPVFRGFPVPWFVSWLENGEPEFRAMDGRKLKQAIAEDLCWVCGEKLGQYKTFVVGPMCAVNRVSAEPPSHLECAHYSACNCPFLSKPQMVRRENDLPETVEDPPGIMIRRNPGVTLLWTTKSYQLEVDARGGVLFRISEPSGVAWYREGRPATRAEVEHSTMTGLPVLQELCQRPEEHMQLGKQVGQATELWPKE